MASQFRATSSGQFSGEGLSFRCAIGKGGLVAADRKVEGDGASPVGTWTMRRVYWRSDRVSRPDTALAVQETQPDDGWCDAPDDPMYNRAVKIPYPASHEKMWREDHVYDLVVELDHNADPVVPGKGSAIFLHLAKPDYPPTEGCVALALEDILEVLRRAGPQTVLQITD